MTSRRFTAAVAVLLFTQTGPAPADQKAAPPPSGPSSRSSLPNVPILGVPQKPDLVVTFEGNAPGLPKGFTVKNVGNGDSKLSVLKVAATFLPPEAPAGGGGSGGCPPFMSPEQCAATKAVAGAILGKTPGSSGGSGGTSVETIKKACGNPFPEVLEAVPALKPGESKTFTRDTGPYQVLITGVLAQPVSPQITHVKQCSPTLICAWDVKAVVDASNDNDERNEGNNTATRRALREVSFK